jgi:hypothetical protein
VPAESVIARSFAALLKHFCWYKFVVIFEKAPVNVELFESIQKILEEEYQKRKAGQSGGGAEESNGKKTKKMETENEFECLGDGKFTIINESWVNHPFSEVCLFLGIRIR